MKAKTAGDGVPIPGRFLPLSLLLAGILFTLYSVSLGHNFLFDEQNIIIRNPHIKDLSGIRELFRTGFFYLPEGLKSSFQSYYRPLTSLTIMLDYRFWRADPLGYNLTSLFLHGLVGIALFKFLLMTVRNEWASFLGALFYTVHPVHTEAVAQISGRGDMLAGLFILCCLILYLRSRDALAWFGCLLALLSKETAVLIPVYLFFLDICFVKSRPRVFFRRILPFLTIALLYFAFRRRFCPVEISLFREAPREAALRVLSMGPALFEYLRTVFCPGETGFFRSVVYAGKFSGPVVYSSLAAGACFLILWFAGLRCRRAGFFGLSVFLAGLAPFSQLVHFYPEWAEHYLYIPALGIAVMLAYGLALAGRSRSRFFRVFCVAACVLLTSFICARTWARNLLYSDLPRYYETLAASDSPYAVFGYHELARTALAEKDPEAAVRLLEKARTLGMNLSVTYHYLAGSYSLQKMPETALYYHMKAADAADLKTPHRVNAAGMLLRLGRYDEAGRVLKDALKESPGYVALYRSLMNAEELAGRPEEAMRWFRRGLAAAAGKRELDSTVLRFTALRLLYRQGPEDVFNTQLAFILKKDADVFWYGDVARLLSGQTAPSGFADLVRAKYGGFNGEASEYLLMAYVLRKQPAALREFLDKNQKLFEGRAETEPLFRMELEKARGS